MKFSFLIIFVNVFFINSLLLGQDESDWKLIKSCDNDIKAYVKKMPESKINRVKIETVIEASLSELVALLKDAENHHNWVFLNERSEIIDEESNFKWRYYGYTKTPWPVSDRDFYTDVWLNQNETDYSVTLTSHAIPDLFPVTKDCIRIPYIYSIWTLNPIGNGSVHILFELEVDVGGSIPTWLTNMAVTKGPVNTINGLIEELNTNKYKNFKLDYIKEM